MVYNLHLQTPQKLALAAVFSLAIIDVIFDILRTVESLDNGTFSGVDLWASLEIIVAVIVSSLPLYRVLLSRKGRDTLRSKFSRGFPKHGTTSGMGGLGRSRLPSYTNRSGGRFQIFAGYEGGKAAGHAAHAWS